MTAKTKQHLIFRIDGYSVPSNTISTLTTFNPSDLAYLLAIGRNLSSVLVGGSLYYPPQLDTSSAVTVDNANASMQTVQKKNAQVVYSHNENASMAALVKDFTGAYRVDPEGKTMTRLYFEQGQFRVGRDRLAALIKLGQHLDKRLQQGINLDYTTDIAYRDAPLKESVSFNGITLAYLIPYSEEKAQQYANDDLLRAQMNNSTATLNNESASLNLDSALSGYSTTSVDIADEEQAEAAKKNKLLRYVGMAALAVAVVVALVVMVKKLKK